MPRSRVKSRFACAWVACLVALAVAFRMGKAAGWTPPANFSEQPELISASPALLCDAANNTHALWVERKDNDARIYYRTDARGAWSPPRDVLAQPSIDRLVAATGSGGYLYALWTTNLVDSDLMLSRAPLAAADDPRQWAQPWPIASSVRAGDLFIDSSGVLRVVYAQSDESGMNHDLALVSAAEPGERWDAPVVIASFSSPAPSALTANLVVDERGRAHVAWGIRSGEYGAYSSLGYLRSDEGMTGWDEPVELASAMTAPGVDMPKVFAFGADEIHITWSEPAQRHMASSDGGATWAPPETIADLGAAFGGHNQLVKDNRGVLHAITAVGDGVFYSRNSGAGWGPAEPIDHRAFDPHEQQLVLCQGNQLHAAYYDRSGDNEIWYSVRAIDAPPQPRGGIPAAVVLEAAAPAAATRFEDRARETSAPRNLAATATVAVVPAAPLTFPAGPLAPAMVGALSATGVILVVAVVSSARRNRRRGRW